MKQELELARLGVARWAKTPTFISHELMRKDIPNARELAWVYWPLVGVAVSTVMLALSIAWLAMPFTMHSQAVLSVVFWSTAMLVSMAAAITTCFGDSDPLKPNEGFCNYTGRKKVVLYERNRKRMPWHRERLMRAREGDKEHPQLSVWFTATNGGVQFHVLAHTRAGLPGPWRVRKYERNGRPASNFLKPVKVEEDPEGRDWAQQILDERERMEEMAQKAERAMYGEVVDKYRTTSTVLGFRR